MRKVSVFSLAGIAAVGLLASAAQGATLYGSEVPNIRLGLGQAGSNVFDLNDFFDTTGTGAVTYTNVQGGTINGSVLSVNGNANPGAYPVSFTVNAGGETLNVSTNVYVSASAIGNGPDIDDNNRIAGQNAGNLFLVGLTPGSSYNSSQNLVLPAGGSVTGGGATDGGATGGAALITTIATLELEDAGGNTGLWVRDHTIEATGTNSASVANELTATLNANGSYTLTAGPQIDGDYIVTFGAQVGSVVDAVHMVAAEATDVNLSVQAGFAVLTPDGATAGTATFGANGVSVSVGPGQGVLVISTTPVQVGDEPVTIQAEVQTNSASTLTAVVGFDATGVGTIDPVSIAYSNPGGTNVQPNARKVVATTIHADSGSVLPAFQVFNPATAAGNATVSVSKLSVIMAGPLTDYALNVNAKADMTVDGSISGVAGWGFNIIQPQNAAGPTLDPANHFTSGTSQGSLKLAGTTAANDLKLAQAFTSVSVDAGTVTAEAYVRRVGTAAAGSSFILAVVDAENANSFASFNNGTKLSADAWHAVSASGTLSNPATLFVVLQAANVDVLVDDVNVWVIDDEDMLFDSDLLGL